MRDGLKIVLLSLFAVPATAQTTAQTVTQSAAKQAIKPALRAHISLFDLDGRAIDEALPDRPFTIEVAFQNEVGSDAPGGLALTGWLRPLSSRNVACVDAARAYHATQRLPIGTVDLNGAVVAALMEDGTLTIVDPDFNLASANLIDATTFDDPPDLLISDPFNKRFFTISSKAGEIFSLAAAGGDPELIASGLARPSTVLPSRDGSMWIYESGAAQVVHISNGQTISTHPALGVRIDKHGTTAMVFDVDGVSVIDSGGGNTNMRLDISGVKDVVAIQGQEKMTGIATLSDSGITIHYVDAPDAPVHIPLTESAGRIVIDPYNRFLFAYSEGKGSVSIVDIARGHLAQVVGASSPVVEIAFAGRAAFMMAADQSRVGAIDLGSIKRGRAAKIREISLGTTRSQPLRGPGLLSAVLPEDIMLAVHADSRTGFPIHDYSVMGDAPPMSAISFRGGIPAAIAAIDRGFQEVETGRFRTTTTLPDARAYELVATTGIGTLSVCVPVSTGSSMVKSEPGAIGILKRHDVTHLTFSDSNGAPVRFEGELTFSSLLGGWRRYAHVVAGKDGITKQVVQLPDHRPIVVTARSYGDQEFHPFVLGDSQ